MLKIGKPLEKLFQTFNDAGVTSSGAKEFPLENLIIPNTIRSIKNNLFSSTSGVR